MICISRTFCTAVHSARSKCISITSDDVVDFLLGTVIIGDPSRPTVCSGQLSILPLTEWEISSSSLPSLGYGTSASYSCSLAWPINGYMLHLGDTALPIAKLISCTYTVWLGMSHISHLYLHLYWQQLITKYMHTSYENY